MEITLLTATYSHTCSQILIVERERPSFKPGPMLRTRAGEVRSIIELYGCKLRTYQYANFAVKGQIQTGMLVPG
jgi:hypothetical protein